ncbi:MAG: hypothetical protein IPG29_10875 [Sphingobacteriales bacterium]|nr:hypothetical protein [Sphingobacteriales bacterium]
MDGVCPPDLEFAGFGLFVWTFANLVPRAVAHHQWYHKQFANYPPYRKAIFPFLW